MKSKIKRHSRSVLAVVLTLCMLVSCMTVGLIATDAARVTDSGTVGAQENSEDVGAMIDDTDSAVGAQENSDSVGDGEPIASGSTLIVNSGCYGNTTLYAYFFGGSTTNWVSLTRITSGNFEGKYYCTVPAGRPTKVIICRMSESTGSWDKRLNQTDDASLTGNYVIVSSNWGSSSSNVDGKGYKKETVSVSAKEFKVFVRNGSSNNHSVEESYFLTNDNGSGVFSITTPAIVAADTHFEVKNYNYNNGGTDVWYGSSGENNYWLNNTIVGNSYTVTASVDIKDVSTADWTGSTFSIALASSDSHYSLTGDIWSSCITQINGATNTITRGSEDDGTWWGSYHSAAAIGTSTGTTGEYYIDITTADRATLVAGNPTFKTVDIGLYNNSENKQKAFKIGNTYYNEIGKDYKVTSSGVTNADIVDLATTNGGGALKLQPGRSYRITVNETTSTISVKENPHVDKYFLAGQYAADGTAQFFGETWNTSNNELIYNSSTGKYELEFTENIPAGTISFKTVKNGDSDGWDGGSYPAQNQSYKINANATKVKFSFDATNNTMTVTQENSGGGEGGTWPPTDTAVTNVTGSNTPTSNYLLIADNDAFENGNGKTMTAVALSKKYDDGSNYFYWLDLTDYLSYSNIHLAISTSNSTSGRWSSESRVSDKGAFGDFTKIEPLGSDGTTKLFTAEKRDKDQKYRAEVNSKSNKLNHLGVLIRTNKKNESTYWTEYSFFYTDTLSTPVVEATLVDIYAKNGTLREDYFNRFTKLADTTIENYFYYEETNASTGEVTTYNSISDYNTAHSSKQIAITHNISYGGSTYEKMENVPVGAKIKISTELSPNSEVFTGTTKFSDSHYLKAYSFNGVTYKVFKPADGVATTNGKKYTEEWKVRAVNTTYHDANDVLQNATTNGNTVEVTPIYYMQDNKNCKTFYIDGYDGTVQNAWGNMLTVYPYYENLSASANAFGGYPGQPMLLWGGKYQMEIPLTVDGTASGATVKGLTLHNGYWDLLHRSIDIRCNARNHAQTYDYDDFYKLYKEKNPDTIIFDFKYKTANDNFGDGYDYFNYDFAGTSGSEPTKDAAHYAASGKNGVEIVTDYFGRQVDVFGNLLTDSQKSDYDSTHPQDKELLIVSTGYKDTYVGEYATLWAVYAPQNSIPSGSGDTAGKFIGFISSSELYLNSWDNASKYPVSDHGLLMTDSRFENTYKHLKDYYTGVPALITYEREIWNDSKDKANRSDGKWYYSNTTDKIQARIKIQYGSYTLLEAPDHSVSSDAWNDDPFDTTQTGVGGEKNIGTNTDCSAYFTNTSPNLMGKTDSGEQFADSKKSFTFQAVPSGSYMFAGWVRYSNGKYYEITENEIGESPMSANDVYIARFVDAQTGSLTIQHVVEQTDEYNGTGTPSVTVHVKNGGTDVTGSPYIVSDGSKIDISKWIDSHYAAYTIDISLTTTPNNESFMKNIASSSGNYAPATSTWNSSCTKTNSTGADMAAKTTTVAQFTVQSILDSGITSLRYVSHLMKPLYTYNYEITYTYTSRFWGVQSYTQTGTCEEGDFTGSKTSAVLNTDFIINKTPYEKNFRQQINWNYTNSAVASAGGTNDHGAQAMVNNAATAVSGQDNTYEMTAHVYASNTINDKVTAEFVLPYKYNEKAQGYTVKDTDVYNSSGTKSGTSYLYDSGNESVTLSTKAYSLFTYDDENHTGSDDDKASSLPLMEAAPYLMKDDSNNPISYHYEPTNSKRYYTGNSFKVGNTTYYLREKPDGSAAETNEEIITDAAVRAGQYTVTFTKRSNMTQYGGDGHTTTYKYAVASGTPGTLDYKVYFFAYAMNANEEMVDNEGRVIDFDTEDPVFNGQYIVYSESQEKDGIIEGTGVKKYFTRWDIFNTKGDYVASCYNRRFNYSGYDNYVVKPVYNSDTENSYASSTGDGYKSQINFLDDSRNQWNNNGGGDYASTTDQSALWAGDKIFADFAVTYNYNGQNINTVPNRTTDSTNGADIKIGVVIERLDKLDKAGSTTITDTSYYANKYKGDTGWQNLAGRLEGSTSGTLTSAVTSGHKCYNSKIGANVSGFGTQFGNFAPGAIAGQTSVIDNFNRLQWFYTINNSTQSTSEATATVTEMKDYAYRAISYIIVTDSTGTHATLTDTPAYFTIYDTATRTGN